MVGSSKRVSSSSSGSGATKSLLKKARPLQQSQLSFRPSSSSSSNASGGGGGSNVLRQASLHQLKGVVHYDEEEQGLDVATTLYLGEQDLLRLKTTLETSTEPTALLRVLRRLSTVPCTRQCLESTRIGVAVGHLRRHADDEVKALAEAIVGVWKRQIKEERLQQQSASHAKHR